jgi:protein-disulfide isomerase
MMMKKLIVFAALAAAPSLYSAPITPAVVEKYATRAFNQCPGQSFQVEPVQQTGPAGFDIFKVTQTSSDEYCGIAKYILISPKSGQTIVGSVIRLPDDPRPVQVRVGEHASALLKAPMTARIAPILLPDGLKAVTLMKDTPFGSFPYNGYIDASENFLVVGMRGNLNEAPEKTLREQLGLSAGARRGTATAKNEIIEISDFECPTCGRAHKTLEPLVAKNVAKVNYIRIDMPLFEHHQWAFQAAMGARAIQRVAPAKYWDYVNTVFANQEILTKETIDAFVKNYATDHDIDWAAAGKIYDSATERQALLDQISRAFALGIVSTPTYIINGQVMGYGPEGEYTINAVRKTLGLPPVKIAKPVAKTPTTKKK